MKKKLSLFIATSSFATNDEYISKIIKNKNIICKINHLKKKLSEKEIVYYANKSTHIIAGTENYTDFVLRKLPNLKYIFRLGSGVDNINLEALKKKKNRFFKIKYYTRKGCSRTYYRLCAMYIKKNP
tara:strand:+ start:354 stop:734 length:381 start_codon:yes stop_codon:yes gene_type:complete